MKHDDDGWVSVDEVSLADNRQPAMATGAGHHSQTNSKSHHSNHHRYRRSGVASAAGGAVLTSTIPTKARAGKNSRV